MPIATGHEREELEAELEVSPFVLPVIAVTLLDVDWLFYLFLLNFGGLGKRHSGN